MPDTADEKVPTTYPTKPPLDKKCFNVPSFKSCTYICLFRFKPNTVKSIIQTILNEELSGKQYNAEYTPHWTRLIADRIKDKIKGNIINIKPNFYSEILQYTPFLTRVELFPLQDCNTSVHWWAKRGGGKNVYSLPLGCRSWQLCYSHIYECKRMLFLHLAYSSWFKNLCSTGHTFLCGCGIWSVLLLERRKFVILYHNCNFYISRPYRSTNTTKYRPPMSPLTCCFFFFYWNLGYTGETWWNLRISCDINDITEWNIRTGTQYSLVILANHLSPPSPRNRSCEQTRNRRKIQWFLWKNIKRNEPHSLKQIKVLCWLTWKKEKQKHHDASVTKVQERGRCILDLQLRGEVVNAVQK